MKDVEGSGVLRRTNDGEMYGESVVIANHRGGMNAILLKIPKEIHDLNKKAKEKFRKNESLKDLYGRPADVRVQHGETKDVEYRNEGSVSMETLGK